MDICMASTDADMPVECAWEIVTVGAKKENPVPVQNILESADRDADADVPRPAFVH